MTVHDESAAASYQEKLQRLAAAGPWKIILSKPAAREIPHQKIVVGKSDYGQ